MDPTNLDLVNIFTQCLNDEWGYVYGAQGEYYTESLARKWRDTNHPIPPGGEWGRATYFTQACKKWYGHNVADCSGGITYAIQKYNPNYRDRSADTYNSEFVKSGNIDNLPEIPGLALWRKGHIGLYVGDMKVIHFAGTKHGCIQSDVSTRSWTRWGMLPGVSYTGIQSTSKLDAFLRTIVSSVGQGPEWTCSQTGTLASNEWSAAFIVACARVVGALLNTVIPKALSCSDIPRLGIAASIGQFMVGPSQNKSISPQVGDLICLRERTDSYTDIYSCSSIGCITDINKDTIVSVFGNYCGKVGYRKLKVDSKLISGLYRPNWDNAKNVNTPQLYTSVNSRMDGIARKVGYLNSNYKPSISPSNIGLSVINYTSALGSIFEIIQTNSDEAYQYVTGNHDGSSVDASQLDHVPRIILEFLMNKGLNAAAACGIIANAEAESGFDPSNVSDKGMSFGLFQWHGSRGDKMKKFVGSDWATDVTGQLEYLWHELNYEKGDTGTTLRDIRKVPNTSTGAQDGAEIFVIKYERPHGDNPDALQRSVEDRRKRALKFWNKLVIEFD